MVAVQLIESPNIISLQTEINKFLEAIDRADLVRNKIDKSAKRLGGASRKVWGYDNIRT